MAVGDMGVLSYTPAAIVRANYEGCSARVAKKRSGCQEKRETSTLAFCAAKISR